VTTTVIETVSTDTLGRHLKNTKVLKKHRINTNQYDQLVKRELRIRAYRGDAGAKAILDTL
jgi:hypothetical protein